MKYLVVKKRRDGYSQRYWCKNPTILTAPRQGYIQVTKYKRLKGEGGL